MRQLCVPAATAAVALAVASLGLSAGPPALADPAAVTSASAAARLAPQIITLINGDRLDVRSIAGRSQEIALEPNAARGGLLSLRLAGSTYEIPTDALPYLGRGLDPSLFSLTALARAERAGRLPVTISFGRKRPALPGVTITRSGHGTAAGYLSAASARVFGAALARQFRVDHRRGTYGQDGLFAAGVSITLAGAPAATVPVRPYYQMRTLTVLGRNLSGQPDTGDLVIVANVANPEIFGIIFEGFSFFYRGEAKFSVPVGTYWAIGDFINSAGTAERLAVLPQFEVKDNTAVTVSERAASSEITMATPRPAVTQDTIFQMIRAGLPGVSNSIAWIDSGLSLWVSPTTEKVTFGGLQTFASATMTSPPKTPGVPYTYNLIYQGPDGLIPAQNYVVTPAQLATVSERFYQRIKSLGGWMAFGGFPAQVGVFFSPIFSVNPPTVQTQYFSAGPDIAWQAQYVAFLNQFAGGQNDSFRTLPAGQQLTEDWGAYPLHPQPDVQLLTGQFADLLPQYPSAFRLGNELYLSETPFSDNYPGHLGAGYFGVPGSISVDSYAVYQNGKRIAKGNPALGVPGIRVSPRPSAIRFVLDAATWGADYPLSPSSQTVWTWPTAAEPHAEVPASWYCGFTASFNLQRQCAVQPLLTLSYQVQGLSLIGLTAPGPQEIDVSVGHVQLAAQSAITGASAQYSLNDGQSWQAASVSSTGAGQFQIGFDAPAGVDVTLRFTAKDAAGGSITETVVRAYGVAL